MLFCIARSDHRTGKLRGSVTRGIRPLWFCGSDSVDMCLDNHHREGQMGIRFLATAIVLTFLVTGVIGPAFAGGPMHGFSYFGDLKYAEGFPHYDYVNPDAPKGGKVTIARIGTFNNLHPFVDKGTAAAGIDVSSMLIYDPLMKYSYDEPWAAYCNLAASVELADDYTWVEFTLKEGVYWHDGVPMTVEDIIWTYNTIVNEGAVGWRANFKDVLGVEQVGPTTVRFTFGETAPRTAQPAIDMADFWPLPKHYWKDRKFNATTLEIPLGSGPYRIKEVDAGHRIVYERVEDYWGKDLPVNIGYYNFDTIEYIYFLDKNVVVQAHKAHVFDFRYEGDAKSWATAYDFDGYHRGLFKKDIRKLKRAYGMNWGIIFNTRLEKFSDIKTREALTLAYNFEWSNRVLWYGDSVRNTSFFMGSELAATGLPSAAELALLEPYRDQLPARVFTDAYTLPKNEPTGRNRDTLIQADELLEAAGWVIRDFKRVNRRTGEPFVMDFLARSVDEERLLIPYVDNLKRLGIGSRLRRVESSQAINRLRRYDFEVIVMGMWQNDIPLHWLVRSYFRSQNADRNNMRNFAGIRMPAADLLVEKIIAADTQEDLNVFARALDRIVLWNFFVVPGGYPNGYRMVYWDRFGYPEPVEGMRTTGFHSIWWFDEEKSARIDAGIVALENQ